jgi:hypothetical protein
LTGRHFSDIIQVQFSLFFSSQTKRSEQMTIEICTIRWVPIKSVAGFATLTSSGQYAAFLGSKILAQSAEVVWHYPTFASEKKQLDSRQKFDGDKEEAYQQVLQALLKNGWEPIGADEEGRMMSFKRQK